MSKSTIWADLKKGASVELAGKTWTVLKIKSKGEDAKVTVERRGRQVKSVVRLKDAVTVVSATATLTDASGLQSRWATQVEHDAALNSSSLAAGDATITRPQSKPSGDPWQAQRSETEAMITDLLQARLVGEAADERVGYYVPPVGITTVAAHLALFHGGIPDAVASDDARMIAAHEAQHVAALTGAPLAVNHWHTDTRPKTF